MKSFRAESREQTAESREQTADSRQQRADIEQTSAMWASSRTRTSVPCSALCALLFALCSLLAALCSLPSALCSLLSAVCSLLSAVCSLLSAFCCLLSCTSGPSSLQGEEESEAMESDAKGYHGRYAKVPQMEGRVSEETDQESGFDSDVPNDGQGTITLMILPTLELPCNTCVTLLPIATPL